MIPGLLHGRVLVVDGGGAGGGAGGIIASPAYRSFETFGAGVEGATATFTADPDGTWQSTGDTGAGPASTFTGSWFLPTTAGAGDAYEVRITPSKVSGDDAVVSNQAADWISASSAKLLSLKLRRFTAGESIATYSVLVEFRPAGGGAVVSSGTFDVDLTAKF